MKNLTIKTFGNSMLPFLADGDILNIKKITFQKIQINNLITFKYKSKFITHRIIYKNVNNKNAFFITKGDNNPIADYKIYPKQIIGKVESIKRNNRTLNITDLYFFQSTLYFQEIIKTNKILTKNKIDFLILKGLPLHLYYEKKYPNRIYADCDILIDKNQFLK